MNKPTRFNRVPDEKAKPKQKEMGTLPRLEFDLANINKFMEERGIPVLWEKSYLCPCRNPMTLSPDPSCSICHGRGIAYLPPHEIKMIIQSQEKGAMNMDIGLYDSGTAIGTTGVNSQVTFRDRIALPHIEVGQSMLFNIDQDRLDNGFLFPYDVKRIEYTTTQDGQVLEEGEDFSVNYKKNIFYPTTLLLNKNVSINITVTLRYIVQDLLKESRYQDDNKYMYNEEFIQLPKKLLLKREDAWVNPIPFTNTDKEGLPLEEPDQDSWDDPKRDMTPQPKEGFFLGGF